MTSNCRARCAGHNDATCDEEMSSGEYVEIRFRVDCEHEWRGGVIMLIYWMPYLRLNYGHGKPKELLVGRARFVPDDEATWSSVTHCSRPPYLTAFKDFPPAHTGKEGDPIYGTLVVSDDDKWLEAHIEEAVAIVYFLGDEAESGVPAEVFTFKAIGIELDSRCKRTRSISNEVRWFFRVSDEYRFVSSPGHTWLQSRATARISNEMSIGLCSRDLSPTPTTALRSPFANTSEHSYPTRSTPRSRAITPSIVRPLRQHLAFRFKIRLVRHLLRS